MTKALEHLIIPPELQLEGIAAGDLLSQVLSQIRLTGDRIHSSQLQVGERLDLERRAAHIVVLKEGLLNVSRGREPATRIDAGDLLLLPRDLEELRITAIEAASLIVCRFWFDANSLRAMLFALPVLIHLGRADTATWLEGLVKYLLLEADDGQPGGALMISRLIDLIVIRTLRTWVHLGRAGGWLGGLSDARVARALRKIHEHPLQRMRIDELAAIAGMSRSSFSERFTALVGCSPLRYQNEWRLRLARDMLTKRSARVGEIAIAVGYESEAAFSRAYKAFFGGSPRAEQKRSFRKLRTERK